MNSRDYWAKREAEALKHYIKDEKEYDKQIQQIYQNMLDACQKEIDSFYAKYASTEGISLAEAKKRVSKLDIAAYERKAKKYVKEKNFSKQANEEMRLYNATMKINRLEMLKANIGLETIAGHDELEKFMAGILKGRTEDELKRQAGILGKTVKNNASKAHAIVNGSFHNGTFSDRIWQYQDLMRDDLGRLLQTALIQGKNPRAVAKDLKKYWYGNDPKTGGGAAYCMERLMRTELARVQTEAQKQSFLANGFEKYQFICNHHNSKSGTCDICKALDGKTFKVADMMPGENASPIHPHCRCSTAAWEDSKEYDAWLDHLANGGTTEEWNTAKKKPNTKKTVSTVGDVKDFNSLDNYLKSSYDISVDESVKKLDFAAVREALVGCESMFGKFRGLAGSIKTIKTASGGIMSCSGETINFNPAFFSKIEKLEKICTEQSGKRFWVKNSDIASIGAHECAHGVEWMLLQKCPDYEYDWQRIDVWNKCGEAKKIVSQACKNVKKTEYGKGKRNADLIGSISRYANENASETMAEAFADLHCNGENANPLSSEISKLTYELLDSYEGGKHHENRSNLGQMDAMR